MPNLSVLSLHKDALAMRAILDAGEVALDGIIGPGHVSAVIGSDAWAFCLTTMAFHVRSRDSSRWTYLGRSRLWFSCCCGHSWSL